MPTQQEQDKCSLYTSFSTFTKSAMWGKFYGLIVSWNKCNFIERVKLLDWGKEISVWLFSKTCLTKCLTGTTSIREFGLPPDFCPVEFRVSNSRKPACWTIFKFFNNLHCLNPFSLNLYRYQVTQFGGI